MSSYCWSTSGPRSFFQGQCPAREGARFALSKPFRRCRFPQPPLCQRQPSRRSRLGTPGQLRRYSGSTHPEARVKITSKMKVVMSPPGRILKELPRTPAREARAVSYPLPRQI